ncbi:homeobox-DDT domain protein RLT1 isoform X2 [Nymphaea colorata]|uniref:homeobox-DDT domain protein RLT1 isoform X2 n=1 Tax=Nymphaea colorata TaxID=210225 RepID=UPI00129DC090|nr:homeobox-DDT domain protein RLT1 isoform X2 [Nymphaea colorata]
MGKVGTPLCTTSETCDMGSEEEKVSPVKSKKRTLKTASQIEALEKFYDEHKYPSEPMKAQLAEKLGLSEKQVQGWFCHRRSKDKKLSDEEHTIRKNELQSSVNDCASGVRHDSCSSSRQGEHFYDFKEVESQRFQSQAYPCSGSDLRKRYLLARNFSVVDDTSSGSSSASQDKLDPDKYLYGMKNVRYSSTDHGYENMNIKDKPRVEYMPVLDALYMDEASEHPSILAVKTKLGKMYRMDGPPLGTEFQPIPPCAFDSPLRDNGHEPYYMGDSIQQSSQRMPRSRTDCHAGRIHVRAGNAFHSSDSCLRESGHMETLPSLFLQKYACDAPMWNPANQFNQMPDLHPEKQVDEFSDSEASEFISNESEAWSAGGMRGMPITNPGYHDHSYSGNVNKKRSSFLQIHPHKVFANMAEDEVNSTRKLKKEKLHERPRINRENDSPAILSSNLVRRKKNVYG